MYVIETEPMPKFQMDEFENWFNDTIGTDYDMDSYPQGWVMVMGDIEQEEYYLIRNKLNGKVYIL